MAIKAKTNVMRILDSQGLPYQSYDYGSKHALSGVEVAAILNQDPAHVFKTLVAVGYSKKHYVFLIPVAKELSLKKAAAAADEKSIEMVKSKELFPLTGYVHGGCSPIGMKKAFTTMIDATVETCDTIMFSAGKIGFQVEMTPNDLYGLIGYRISDLTL